MRISDWSSDVCSSDLFGLDRLRLCGGQGFDVYRVGDCGSFQRFQRRDFLGRCRDHQFSAAAIRDAAGFAEVVELPPTFDTEDVLERARWIIKAGVYDFAAARTDPRPDPTLDRKSTCLNSSH